ncbi:MAG: hypothetical protein IH857_07465, partial [Deltaproteobacteria bacterium]|nr:hypothetical protein [Deltaproteobacteria bacterium]
FTPWVSTVLSLLTYPILALSLSACAPRVVQLEPKEGAPGIIASLSMEYLVGWPRVAIGGHMLNFYQLELSSADPKRQEVPGKELVWIEDKVLQFRIPDLPPGEYLVTIYDDKGPPEENVYAFLETTAYVIFPPVWPFVFRSNEAQVTLRVLPGKSGQGKMKNAK